MKLLHNHKISVIKLYDSAVVFMLPCPPYG